ncbi:tyrosine-type recombinase/integrase [Prosthecobacter sp.]|uniref:tyrosine-type recombinase/integrase n=1 Tax=Prosthecobacter sp. TaxID=1965333 RepID=UPI00248A00FB|nr:tyrosine-type recombinase/integrase [Prosthecobacter sp.]MDI1313510.1 tyrosine-type recombinase/integrase [Prosthecobacter sp.]
MSASTPDETRPTASNEAKKRKHLSSRVNENSVREVSEDNSAKKTLGKADTRYWLQPGKLISDPRWGSAFTCKVQVHGRRESFPLRTKNKSTAAAKAAKIYGDVVALGWEAALAKHKPDEKPIRGALTGDLIREVSSLADVRPATLAGNVAAFRRIVAAVMKIDATKGRYARVSEERATWLASIDAVPLEKITPAAVEAWKLAFVATRTAGDETKARAARITANTTLRSAKSLFAKRILRFISSRLTLPSPLPFDGVEFYARQSMRYVSTMNLEKILAEASSELACVDREAFKAFILCLFAGLRRSEADKLRWESIDFERGLVRIETHAYFSAKSETSLGEVPIDSEVTAILRGLRAKEPQAEYVLAGGAPKPLLKRQEYRANDTFQRLLGWLRDRGVQGHKPLHTLRKEAGSLICQKAGLFAASRFLRHADVGITAQHYAAQKDRVTVGLGALLAPPKVNVIAGDFCLPSAPAAFIKEASKR